jgi:hypothetical protein
MIPSQFPTGIMIEKKDLEMLKKKYNADGVVITLEVGDMFFYKGICDDEEDIITGSYNRDDLED